MPPFVDLYRIFSGNTGMTLIRAILGFDDAEWMVKMATKLVGYDSGEESENTEDSSVSQAKIRVLV
jgi:hypothetical protein